MTLGELLAELDCDALGGEMHALIRELYPSCRSITGDGVRETLRRLGDHIELTTTEVASGTEVYDWTVPREWNIRDAYVKNGAGERVIDFRESNLHVVSYSVPVHRTMRLAELRGHLHTIPEHPDWIPYRTSYYSEGWGFCLPHSQLVQLPDGEYEVCIDSTLEDGHLTYGECLLRGATDDEVLISCHVCHPSLCNDNLSGIAVAAFLAKQLAPLSLRNSYRFLFVPGTIGSICWLSGNEERLQKIRHGLVLTCVGDAGSITYKKSRAGDAVIDRAVAHVLESAGRPFEVRDFVPYGYDERQYCSPGFDLPVGCMMRTPFGEFPEYHSSADNLEFVRAESLAHSLATALRVFDVLEHNLVCRNLKPKGEPRLGKRGLYDLIGGERVQDSQLALLWVLNQSDGRHDLLAIAEKSGLPFSAVRDAATALLQTDLLEEEPRR
jgi:aminopeptidase-like protein